MSTIIMKQLSGIERRRIGSWLSLSVIVLLWSTIIDAQTSPSAFTTGYRYSSGGLLTGVIKPDPDGSGPINYAAVRNTYANGLLMTVESGELATWQPQSIAPAGWNGFTVFRVVTYTYDSMGRKTSELESSAGTTYTATQYSYDTSGRLQCTAVRMNPAIFSSLPASACALGAQGTAGPDRITYNTYDARIHLLQVKKAYGTALQENYATYVYNGNEISSVTDANNNLATMTYDGLAQLSQWNFPSKTAPGQVSTTDFEKYGYDANGNRTSLTKRDGTIINYSYDNLNRVSLKHFPSNSAADVYYAYDLRNLQLSALFGSATGQGVATAYDGFGQVSSTSVNLASVTRSLSYQYDANSNRTHITHPDGSYFVYSYDGLDRMNGITENGAATLATVVYDNKGRRSTLTRGGGVATSSYGYDAVSRLASLTHDLDGAAVTYDQTFSFAYNPANQIVQRTLSNGVYSYSAVSGALTTYHVNGLNQYTQIASPTAVTPTYDPNGNMTSDGSTTFGYDSENRLTSATGAHTAALTYDPQGRLFQTSGGTAGTTQFLSDGDSLVAEYNSTGTLLRRYVHGPGVEEPLVWYEGSTVGAATRQYLHADHQGSTIATTNSVGATVATNNYDSYGTPGTSNSGRFQYTGQAMIPELGLYYYRARFYSPQMGRFLQTDPVGYKSDVDLYAYVGNDPLDRTDPTGNVGEATAAGCLIAAEVGCVPGAIVGALVDAAIFVGSAAAVAYGAHVIISNSSDKPAADAPKDGEKKDPPNPNGSRGGEEHQDKIKERIGELVDQGHTHVAGGDKPEETVDTPGGNKESRRPDITTGDPNGKPYRENVGRQNQDGTAVSRERRALEDIRNATGQCAFTPYNCKK